MRIVNNGSGGSVTAGNLSLSSGGTITLRNGFTTIGTGAMLTAGTVYRVAIHQQRGSGSTNGVLEAYLAEGDAPFGTPFASSSQSITSPARRIEVGATNSVTLDAMFDNTAVDTAAFAAP